MISVIASIQNRYFLCALQPGSFFRIAASMHYEKELVTKRAIYKPQSSHYSIEIDIETGARIVLISVNHFYNCNYVFLYPVGFVSTSFIVNVAAAQFSCM